MYDNKSIVLLTVIQFVQVTTAPSLAVLSLSPLNADSS